MAIRFQCAACSQPLEVDDDLAQRLVACPYCRKTVTAPAVSTLADADLVPSASPLSAREFGEFAPPPGFNGVAVPSDSGNALAIVAFALACAVLVLALVAGMILGAHRIELEELTKQLQAAGDGIGDQFRALTEFANERGGEFPGWFMAAGLISMTAIGTWMAALVCGLIAIRRPRRRSFAVAALMICGLYLAVNCAGGLM